MFSHRDAKNTGHNLETQVFTSSHNVSAKVIVGPEVESSDSTVETQAAPT